MERRVLMSTLYVDAHAAGAVQDGSTWDGAFVDLQQALAAATAGTEIHVADGTYLPSASADVTASFQLKDGVKLLGGYAGVGAADPDARNISGNPTILSGKLPGGYSRSVVKGGGVGGSAVLDGFTVSFAAGYGLGPDSGICIISGNPTIQNCTITQNGSWNPGGGMYVRYGNVSIINCNISYNGGGIAAFDATLVVSGCTFKGNSADAGGAAIYSYASSVTATNCSFSGNASLGEGSAIRSSNGSYLRTNNCIVRNERTAASAVAVFGSTGEIYSTTFSANNQQCVSARSNATLTILGSILWKTTGSTVPAIVTDGTGSSTISGSDVQGGWTGAGTGNINADPQFTGSPAGDLMLDLQLKPTSPCVDSGSNPHALSKDFAGNARKVDYPNVQAASAIVDMGAFELQAPLAAISGTYSYQSWPQRLSMSFNRNEVLPSSLSGGDLVLMNLTTGQRLDSAVITTASYANTRATWTLNTILPDGNYTATLPAGSILDLSGNPTTTSFTYSFFVLGGDANRDRRVDIMDLSALASNWQKSSLFTSGNFNGDRIVDSADLAILAANWQTVLSAVPEAAPASTMLGTRPASRTATRIIELI